MITSPGSKKCYFPWMMTSSTFWVAKIKNPKKSHQVQSTMKTIPTKIVPSLRVSLPPTPITTLTIQQVQEPCWVQQWWSTRTLTSSWSSLTTIRHLRSNNFIFCILGPKKCCPSSKTTRKMMTTCLSWLTRFTTSMHWRKGVISFYLEATLSMKSIFMRRVGGLWARAAMKWVDLYDN